MRDRALSGLLLLLGAAFGAYLFYRRLKSETPGSVLPPGFIGPPVPQASAVSNQNGGTDLQKLLGFVQSEGLPAPSPGQTTGGRHNSGSLHYQGKAVDIGARNLSSSRAAQIIQDALNAGFHVIDERVRPAGMAVWGGPNIHLDTGPLSRFAQVAP